MRCTRVYLLEGVKPPEATPAQNLQHPFTLRSCVGPLSGEIECKNTTQALSCNQVSKQTLGQVDMSSKQTGWQGRKEANN